MNRGQRGANDPKRVTEPIPLPDDLRDVVRGLQRLPEPDAGRMRLQRAELEARFAEKHGAEPPSPKGPKGVLPGGRGLPAWLYLLVFLALLGVAGLMSRPEPSPDGDPLTPAGEASDSPDLTSVVVVPGGSSTEAEAEAEGALGALELTPYVPTLGAQPSMAGDAATALGGSQGAGSDADRREAEALAEANTRSGSGRASGTQRPAPMATPRPMDTPTSSLLPGSGARDDTQPTAKPADGPGDRPVEAPIRTDPTPSGSISVRGYVRDEARRGIQDAYVTAWRVDGPGFYLQRSEADGAYLLQLSPGRYILQAEAQGYAARFFDRAAGSPSRGDAHILEFEGKAKADIDFVLPGDEQDKHAGEGS